MGVPPLHIVRAQNGVEYRFYELTGDLPEALHFSHFERTKISVEPATQSRIRLKDEIKLKDAPDNRAQGRVKLRG